jgi:hypothetical protein
VYPFLMGKGGRQDGSTMPEADDTTKNDVVGGEAEASD